MATILLESKFMNDLFFLCAHDFRHDFIEDNTRTKSALFQKGYKGGTLTETVHQEIPVLRIRGSQPPKYVSDPERFPLACYIYLNILEMFGKKRVEKEFDSFCSLLGEISENYYSSKNLHPVDRDNLDIDQLRKMRLMRLGEGGGNEDGSDPPPRPTGPPPQVVEVEATLVPAPEPEPEYDLGPEPEPEYDLGPEPEPEPGLGLSETLPVSLSSVQTDPPSEIPDIDPGVFDFDTYKDITRNGLIKLIEEAEEPYHAGYLIKRLHEMGILQTPNINKSNLINSIIHIQAGFIKPDEKDREYIKQKKKKKAASAAAAEGSNTPPPRGRFEGTYADEKIILVPLPKQERWDEQLNLYKEWLYTFENKYWKELERKIRDGETYLIPSSGDSRSWETREGEEDCRSLRAES